MRVSQFFVLLLSKRPVDKRCFKNRYSRSANAIGHGWVGAARLDVPPGEDKALAGSDSLKGVLNGHFRSVPVGLPYKIRFPTVILSSPLFVCLFTSLISRSLNHILQLACSYPFLSFLILIFFSPTKSLPNYKSALFPLSQLHTLATSSTITTTSIYNEFST